MRIAATATRSADGNTDSDNNDFKFDIVDPCTLDANQQNNNQLVVTTDQATTLTGLVNIVVMNGITKSQQLFWLNDEWNLSAFSTATSSKCGTQTLYVCL